MTLEAGTVLLAVVLSLAGDLAFGTPALQLYFMFWASFFAVRMTIDE